MDSAKPPQRCDDILVSWDTIFSTLYAEKTREPLDAQIRFKREFPAQVNTVGNEKVLQAVLKPLYR